MLGLLDLRGRRLLGAAGAEGDLDGRGALRVHGRERVRSDEPRLRRARDGRGRAQAGVHCQDRLQTGAALRRSGRGRRRRHQLGLEEDWQRTATRVGGKKTVTNLKLCV